MIIYYHCTTDVARKKLTNDAVRDLNFHTNRLCNAMCLFTTRLFVVHNIMARQNISDCQQRP